MGSPAHAQTVITTVPVGGLPFEIAVNPVTNKIYVVDQNPPTNGNVTVIDGITNATTTVSVGAIPQPIAVNSVTNKIYVANVAGNTVTVIDGTSNATATVNVGATPDEIAVNSVKNKIYVSNVGDATVTVIDGASNATTTVPVGGATAAAPAQAVNNNAIAVNAVTNKIYLVNFGANTVTVIDGVTNATTTVPVGANPFGVAVNSVTNTIYVSNNGANTVTVIDGATNATATVTAGVGPAAIEVDSVTNKIYVSNEDGTVTVIDGGTHATATVPMAGEASAIAVNSVTNTIYTANGANTVTVIDGGTNATATVNVGNVPVAIAVNSVTNTIYTVNIADDTVTVIEGGGGSPSPTPTPTPTPPGGGGGGGGGGSNGSARLINISTRAEVGTGANILIPGFVISGSGTETLLIRADGPALTGFGVAGALAQPSLSVFNSAGTVVASNTGWGTNANPDQISSAAASVGAFALTSGSADCALIASLPAGAYTVQISGVGNSTGVALAEVYEVSTTGTRLANISTRALVGTGANIIIPGFVISGSGSEQLLARGDGPALTGFGVAGALAQPSLSVFDSSGNVIASNTGWGTNANPAQLASAATSVGAFALASGSADSALIANLSAGAYTMQLSGVNNSTGVALAEVYEAP
jgi:YVTN family beta-propeller protein